MYMHVYMYYVCLQLHLFACGKLPQLGVKSHLEMVNVFFCSLHIWPTSNLDAFPFVVFLFTSILNTLTVLRIGHVLLLSLLVPTGLSPISMLLL